MSLCLSVKEMNIKATLNSSEDSNDGYSGNYGYDEIEGIKPFSRNYTQFTPYDSSKT